MSQTPSAINSAFLPNIPLQYALDSTSIGYMKRCPRSYQYAIILGYQSRTMNVHLTFGIAYHSAIERYHHAKANGKTHDQSMNVAVRFALETTWNRALNRQWLSDDPNKNRLTLIRTVVWYLDKFEHDPMETLILANGKPAVELSFRLELPLHPFGDQSTSPYLLCGHLDRVATMNNQLYIVDAKTTKHSLDDHYFAQFTPNNQMSTYSFGGKAVLSESIVGIAIDGAQILVGSSRFNRQFINRTPEQLDEWFKDITVVIKEYEQYALSGYWRQNDSACFGCDFRKICSKSPSVRQPWLEQGFTKRTWDPLVARGDV